MWVRANFCEIDICNKDALDKDVFITPLRIAVILSKIYISILVWRRGTGEERGFFSVSIPRRRSTKQRGTLMLFGKYFHWGKQDD